MSVVFNPAGLEALLQQEGVRKFMEQQGERVMVLARQNVRDYFHTAPILTVDRDVDLSMEGPNVTIGIRDAGSKSRRLAQKQADGTLNWLTTALDAAKR